MTEKPPLLLLHGVTMSAAAWDGVVPLLAEARTLGIHPDTLVDLLRKEATP